MCGRTLIEQVSSDDHQMSVAGGVGTKVPCSGEGLGVYATYLYHVNVTYLMMHVITYPL